MKNIVIIDDDRKSMESLELAIELDLPDFELKIFQYPEEFEDASIEDISLIILDIMFAGDGEHKGGFNLGIEFYNKYKQKNSSIPFIIYTNKTRDSLNEETIKIIEELNNDIFFEKPSVSLDLLIQKIKEVINSKSNNNE